jgi:hypothetical protein
VGGTLPSVFLPPDRSGAAPVIVADFSARGGEVAKPDILGPGVAYSSVPLWNAGDEVKQGTSMAAPHAAGLAALLLSALAQEKRTADATTIRQALMVTAHPAARGGYLDEGRGVADVNAALAWLSGGGSFPGIDVRVPGRRTAGGWVELHRGSARSGVQKFEIRRPPAVPPATYALRSDAAWLTGPGKVTLAGEVTPVELRYAGEALAAPGAYTGVVTGWPADSLAGPGFRLVTTVVVPAAVADTMVPLRQAAPVPPGDALRSFFEADSARPFEIRVSSSPGQRGLAYLHEPGGAPFREVSARPLGLGPDGALYRVDARDVVPGEYQSVAAAPPDGRLAVTSVVVHSPVTVRTSRTGDVARAELANVTRKAVNAQVELRLRGAQREDTVRATGSSIQRLELDIPSWATGLEVDVAMDRDQWGRFTDFGVTVLDSAGRQIAQDPMEYAFGRLSTVLSGGHGGISAELSLFPGFADPADQRPWSATVTTRLYADSAVTVAPAAASTAEVSIAAGSKRSVDFRLPPAPWPMPDGFVPLGVALVRIGEQVWTRESGFTERSTR